MIERIFENGGWERKRGRGDERQSKMEQEKKRRETEW
jgi:hypothetical protein